MWKLIKGACKSIGYLFYLAFYCIKYQKNPKRFSRLVRYQKMRYGVDKVNRALGIELHVTGKENLPNEQSYLLVPNHQSALDATVMFSIFQEPISFIAKDSLMKAPIIRKVIPIIEGYFLQRDNLRQEIRVMKHVQSSLVNDNIKWIIFPEGTRTKDPSFKMNYFKAGTFKYPMAVGKKIIPVAMYGTSRVLDRKAHAKKYPVYVHFFPAIDAQTYEGKSTQEVAEFTHNLVQSKVDEFIKLDKEK